MQGLMKLKNNVVFERRRHKKNLMMNDDEAKLY